MAVTKKMKKELAQIIKKNIEEEFKNIHLSGNLMNSIVIRETENGYAVDILAPRYNVALYKRTGVIVPRGQGSYAKQVDITGGYSGEHTDYIARCVKKSIQEWITQNEIKAKVGYNGN